MTEQDLQILDDIIQKIVVEDMPMRLVDGGYIVPSLCLKWHRGSEPTEYKLAWRVTEKGVNALEGESDD